MVCDAQHIARVLSEATDHSALHMGVSVAATEQPPLHRLRRELDTAIAQMTVAHDVYNVAQTQHGGILGKLIGNCRDLLRKGLFPHLAQQVEYNRASARFSQLMLDYVESVMGEVVRIDLRSSVKAYRRDAGRPCITVVTNFPVAGEFSGGHRRVLELYGALTAFVDVRVISLATSSYSAELKSGLWEYRVAMSKAHQDSLKELEQRAGLWLVDATLPELAHLTPEFGRAIRQSAQASDVVVACHPYVYSVIKDCADVRLWYDALDVEYDIKSWMYENVPDGQCLLEKTREIENAACLASERILAVSAADAARFEQLYGVSGDRIVSVPNGVNTQSFPFTGLTQRRQNKKSLGLDPATPIAVFVGANWPANVEAADCVVRAAEQLPNVTFLIVGSCSDRLDHERFPENVAVLAHVDDQLLKLILSLADLALNPMSHGTGTNVKIMEYFASGVPVVASPAGARSLNVQSGKHCIVAEIGSFAEAISKLSAESDKFIEDMVCNARAHVAEYFEWTAIAGALHKELRPADCEPDLTQSVSR